MNEIRYCRICWNTQDWQHPTGEAAKLEGTSYVSEHGFGHEEWLLNFGWLIDGYKYGFLQPLQYLKPKLRGNLFDIILYTVAPTRKKFFVGQIKNCELSTSETAAEIYNIYIQQGWLNEMVQDLVRLNIDPEPIVTAGNNPISVTNFRFKPSNVEILKPFVPVNISNKVNRVNRYRPLIGNDSSEWGKIIKEKTENLGNNVSFRRGRLKSTDIRNRAAQEGTAFDPTHDRIQNALYGRLVDLYGEENVGYEDNAVDLVAKQDAKTVFYEIKTSSTAKQCIRLAMGQLLEYSHWADSERAQKLIIVGAISPSDDAKRYLEYLRGRYNLPIYYCQYDLTANDLSKEY